MTGRGKVLAWTIMHEPKVTGFEDALPYACVLVELDEQTGLLMATNFIGGKPHEITAGMRVQVTFEEIDRDIVLPQFMALNEAR